MKIEEVAKLSSLDRLLYWIDERERIRLKKEAGFPRPWTDDAILSSYRFCNVRRMDDKVSQWLWKNWYRPNFNHKNMLLATTLARNFNRPDTLEAIGFPKIWNPDRILNILNERVKKGLKVFSAAYMVTGTLGGTKIEQVLYKIVDPLHKNPPTIHTSSMQNTAASLVPCAGFSDFMAGQVTADLRHAMKGLWADKYTWAPLGPGSKRGLNRLYGYTANSHQTREEFEGMLSDTIELLKTKIPKDIMNRLEAHDLQSCLCEFDKMCRVLDGEGRPKQRYSGGV